MRILAIIVLASAVAAAQTENVEVEPITCWWRSTATAVRVGEAFTVVLTCSVLQTEAARVVADESRLDSRVVQLPPFEVLGGRHPKDLVTAGRRFFQYEYQLRVVAENVFATTVSLPPLEIAYKVESRMEGGESLTGRDQTYALPPMTMRVLSLVPDTATDIYEAPVATFTELQDVGFRGMLMRVVGWVLLALSALVLGLTLVGYARRRRAASRRARLLPDALILRAVRRELQAIRNQSRSGWTQDLAGRALAALRIVAAYAVGRPVTQIVPDRTSAPGRRSNLPAASPVSEGQLAVSGRFGAFAIVSAAVTAPHADDELRDALARFAAARYGREPGFDAKLDDDVEVAIAVADRLIASRPPWERLWLR